MYSEQIDGEERGPTALVDEYIAALDSPLSEIISSLRDLIKLHFPELCEEFKWHVPFYVAGKKNLISINAYSKHVNLYFYNGTSLYDPLSLLAGSGKQVRHLTFHNLKEINEDYVCQLITQAVHIVGAS